MIVGKLKDLKARRERIITKSVFNHLENDGRYKGKRY